MSDFQSKQLKSLITEVQYGSPLSANPDKALISPITNDGRSSRNVTPPKKEFPIDLGTKVVLLSSEVERLTHLNAKHIQEIELWKSKYLQSTSYAPSQKLDESAISQKKVQEYEAAQQALTQELYKLQESLRAKDSELNYWKDKYQVLENTMDNKIKSALEAKVQEFAANLNKERINFDLYRLHMAESDDKIRNLMVEIRRITDILEIRTQEANEARDRLSNVLNERDALNDRCNHLLKQLTEAQSRMSQLVSENSQLSVEMRQRDANANIIKALNFKIDELTGDNTMLSQKLVELVPIEEKVKTQQFQINNLEQLLQAARKENIDLTARMRDQTLIYEEQIKSLKDQIGRLQQEVMLLKGNEYEIDNLKRKNAEINESRELLQTQYYKKEVEMNDIIVKLRAELYDNEKMMRILQEKFKDIEKKIEMFIIDNDRLSTALRERDEQLLKYSIVDFDVTEIKNRNDLLTKENGIMKSDIAQLLAENAQFKEDLPKIIDETEAAKLEIEDLKKEIEVRREREKAGQEEIDGLRAQLEIVKQSHDNQATDFGTALRELENENERLKAGLQQNEEQISNLIQDCENWNDKYENLQKETTAYKEAIIQQLEQHFVVRLNSERAETERILGTKDEQIRNLSDQIADLLSQSRNLQNENRGLKNEIEALSQQHDNIKDEHERVKKSSNNDAKSLDLLRKKINEKDEELEKRDAQIQEFQVRQVLFFIEIERLYLINGEFMQHIATLDTTCGNLARELELAKRRINDDDNIQKIVLGLKQQIETLENRNNVLLNENSKLSELSIQRLKELDDLKNKYTNQLNDNIRRSVSVQPNMEARKSLSDFQENSLKYENQIEALKHENKQLRSVIELKQNEILQLREINDQRKADIENLKGQIQNNPRIRQLEGENKLLGDQVEQIKIEYNDMKRNRDLLRSELEKESKKNYSALNEMVRESIRGNGDSPLKQSVKMSLSN